MIKTECSKKDCFFRLEDMCCNLCAPGNDSCSLYWVADSNKQDDVYSPDGEYGPDGERKARRQHMANDKLASAL